jgi:hypothetical protein
MSSLTWSKFDAVLLAVVLSASSPALAYAEPLRLRGEAYAETKSPVGLLVLRGEDKLHPWLDVETVTWLGASGANQAQGLGPTGDVLTLSVRARDLASGSEIRAGRMIVSMGAIRPVQLDGVRALGRAFGGTTLEAFGGLPVMRLDQGALRAGREFDWTTGGRLGQAFDVGSVGASYALRRRGTSPDDEEVGADLSLTPAPWFTAAGRAAFDLLTRGPTEALVSMSAQKRDARAEVFVTQRSAGRLLPSTSLFSVLGDFAATSSGATLRWRAFPRLELLATGSVQVQASDVGGQGLGRTTLALDDDWQGSVGLELRRVDFGGSRWAGARTILAVPISQVLQAGAEIELVRPDDSHGRGTLWPWALGSVAWSSRTGWEIATGIEASSGPTTKGSVQGLARASYAFSARPPPQSSKGAAAL